MTFYIQMKRERCPLETVDEFETRKEAQAMRKEYCLADPYATYRISTLPCKAWKEKS